tara:strand:+ start:3824 stop:4072 length:249 start_codon:yes stop_codon:yes gene_type:complete
VSEMTWDYYNIKKEEETLTSSNTITDSRSADSYLSMRTRLNKAFDAIYDLINPLVEQEVLDYQEDLMEFTRVVDKIMKKLGE